MLLRLQTVPTPTGESDLVDRLLECHERIRRFSQLAVTLARTENAPAADVADAAGRVHRYFAVAMPLHVADEDLSFEPRLLLVADAQVVEALARMRAQHVTIEEQLAVLLPVWERLVREPAAIEEDRAQLLARSEAIAALLEDHLQGEERVLFPFTRKHLPRAQMDAIVGEMQARRRPRA